MMQYQTLFQQRTFVAQVTKSSTVDTYSERIKKDFAEHLFTPSGMMLVSCLAGMGALHLLNKGKRNRKDVATGGAGTYDVLKNARKLAIEKDLGSKELGDACLWIGDPNAESSIFFRKILPGILIEGGPNSGKSFGGFEQLELSAIAQKRPIVLWDFKYPHQASRISAYAAKNGYKIHVLAPSYPETGTLDLTSLLKDERTRLKAEELAPEDGSISVEELIRSQVLAKAEELVNVIKTNSNALAGQDAKGDPFFDDAAVQIISGIMTLIQDWDFNDFLTVQAFLSTDNLPARLWHSKDKIPPSVFLKFNQLITAANANRQLAATVSTCQQLIDKILGQLFLPALCGKTTIPLDLGPGDLLVIGLDKNYRKSLAPILSAIIHAIISRNIASPRSEPLVFCTDELPTIILPELSSWLSEGRSDGFCGILGFQARSQMVDAYGENKTKTTYTACPSKMFFNPNDIERAEVIAKWTGNIAIDYRTDSKSFQRGGRSCSDSGQVRVRMDIEATGINRMPQGTALLISPGFTQPGEAFVPVRTKIKIPSSIGKILDESQALWKSKIRPKLIERSHAKVFGDQDIAARRAYIEEMFPLPEPEEEQSKPKNESSTSSVGEALRALQLEGIGEDSKASWVGSENQQ